MTSGEKHVLMVAVKTSLDTKPIQAKVCRAGVLACRLRRRPAAIPTKVGSLEAHAICFTE
jgi:hypothetical protein